MPIYDISPTWRTEVQNKARGGIPTCDNSSIGADLVAWNQIKTLLEKSANSGTSFSQGIVSTYSLPAGFRANGGVLAPNGDIHFVPCTNGYNGSNLNRAVGRKINSAGLISTYSLVYNAGDYVGGVLAMNGDIHFVPSNSNSVDTINPAGTMVGQKINSSGVVSTYSLVAPDIAYSGGVLSPNGDIHFVPYDNWLFGGGTNIGQKVSAAGVVSTYSLVNPASYHYGGVLAPNGDIHFVPNSGNPIGQKINSSGVVSTYSLVYTAGWYIGGVLAPNGDIHFVPRILRVGQKINIQGVVSTYSLAYTTTSTGVGYANGVLAPNGDVYFIPLAGNIPGQKVSSSGVVSTYSLIYQPAAFFGYSGGILTPNGDIQFIASGAPVGQKISTLPAKPLNIGVCCSPFLNKY
jgi:hypothetical protein